LDTLISHGSLALMFAVLIAAGLGLPFPEDVVLLAAGALAHRGIVPLSLAAIVCGVGVLAGDLIVFHTAKKLGPEALDKARFRRLLTEERRRRAQALFDKHGGKVIFVARHLAGIRVPIFALAGINGLSTVRFLVWDVLGLCITGPLYIGLGYLFSDQLDEVRDGVLRVEHVIVGVAVLVVVVVGIAAVVRRRGGSRPPSSGP